MLSDDKIMFYECCEDQDCNEKCVGCWEGDNPELETFLTLAPQLVI